MEYVLIIAAIYNILGAFAMWFTKPALAAGGELPSDYMQYRLFTGGTAFVFGILYLYVFLIPAAAIPLLVFGIALKLWSFVASYISYRRFQFPKSEFLKVGVGNGIFAVLFVIYLITAFQPPSP